ncbi:adenylyltransferase/cytidyltransferase family protein [Pleionea sediminis]|uniref:adenylyltransferase/cytidyltransferase family protein n=1 Tax=Pleionea sediminis TaxID=2569479 RepID=UPI0011862720|nr:adenylyltransferase/cytidyltransferase family protein [Pleionea sediminis]
MKSEMQRIAILGSAFNPPHLGHLDILNQIAWEFDEIWLVPSYCHAFGKVMAPFKDRMAMTRNLAQAFDGFECDSPIKPQIIVSDIEARIGKMKDSPVYTYDLLDQVETEYHSRNKRCNLTFVIGPDNAEPKVWSRFHRSKEILERWSVRRVTERMSVRSSQIRELIADFNRPKRLLMARLKSFTPLAIADYIGEKQLYRNAQSLRHYCYNPEEKVQQQELLSRG